MNNPLFSTHKLAQTTSRKSDHLDICLHEVVESQVTAGWENVALDHVALPNVDFKNINTGVHFLNKEFSSPFLISSMTGGTPAADALNQCLALFAEKKNIPMGLGSMRYLIEQKKNSKVSEWTLSKVAPKACLWANIGAVQFNYGINASDCAWLVEHTQAQALVLHLNPLQEAIQPEGDKNFSGLWKKFENLRKEIKIPLILKETGCGLDPETAKMAVEVGFNAIDIAGLGGTHWGFIEGLRSERRKKIGETFRNWGHPTAECLEKIKASVPKNFPIVASGGIRTGLDCAKAFKLGANLCGLALPFLKAAKLGPEALEDEFEILNESLKIACFVSGVSTPKELYKL